MKFLFTLNQVHKMRQIVGKGTKRYQQKVDMWSEIFLKKCPLESWVSPQKWFSSFKMIVQWGVSVHMVLKKVFTVPAVTGKTTYIQRKGKVLIFGLVNKIVSKSSENTRA